MVSARVEHDQTDGAGVDVASRREPDKGPVTQVKTCTGDDWGWLTFLIEVETAPDGRHGSQ